MFERSLLGSSNGSEDDTERVLRVAEVTREIRLFVEDRWTSVLIEGEVSNVRQSAAGHVYFVLLDEEETAQIAGVMFRSDVVRCHAQLQDGMRMRMRAKLSLYEQRGQFQLIARWVKPVGQGGVECALSKGLHKVKGRGFVGTGAQAISTDFTKGHRCGDQCSGSCTPRYYTCIVEPLSR